eukprot:581101-Pyramimonas_sp.AAC.1
MLSASTRRMPHRDHGARARPMPHEVRNRKRPDSSCKPSLLSARSPSHSANANVESGGSRSRWPAQAARINTSCWSG